MLPSLPPKYSGSQDRATFPENQPIILHLFPLISAIDQCWRFPGKEPPWGLSSSPPTIEVSQNRTREGGSTDHKQLRDTEETVSSHLHSIMATETSGTHVQACHLELEDQQINTPPPTESLIDREIHSFIIHSTFVATNHIPGLLLGLGDTEMKTLTMD